MTLQRRGFLSAMLLAGAAPAVVKASSLMKIIVPSTKIIHAGSFGVPGRGMTQPIYHIDEAGWIGVSPNREYVILGNKDDWFDPSKADERIREMRRVEMPMNTSWFMPPRAPIPMRPLQRS